MLGVLSNICLLPCFILAGTDLVVVGGGGGEWGGGVLCMVIANLPNNVGAAKTQPDQSFMSALGSFGSLGSHRVSSQDFG